MKSLIPLSLLALLFAAACSHESPAPVIQEPTAPVAEATSVPVADVPAVVVKHHKKKVKKELESCSPDALAKAREEGRQEGLKESAAKK